MFSATMPTQLKSLIKTGMRNPYFVEVRTQDKDGIFAGQNDKKNLSVTVQEFDTLNVNK